MDLLGSILGEMSGPPSASASEKARRRKERELAHKLSESNREQMNKFRSKIEKSVDAFVKSDNRRLEMASMSKCERSIVHDVAEVAGLTAHSFGDDDVDRHVILWKKESAPCDDELECCRKGLPWDPEANAKAKAEAALAHEEETKAARLSAEADKKGFVPKGAHYQSKYEHLIGTEAALEAARKTEMNKSYGMVSSEMKKDKRSVEDIQSELREKKKRRLLEQKEEHREDRAN